MTDYKIISDNTPPKIKGPSLKRGTIPAEKYFTFTLRYWSEARFFGLGGIDSGWFTSLLNRLRELSKEKVARFIEDKNFQDAIRLHPVSWDNRAVPITRADLTWLHKDILDNESEFPIYQFHVSKAVGRIHGFWDSLLCFNIVLLDPLHNLQPSKDVGYKVSPTTISNCEFSTLKIAIDTACAAPCADANCQLAKSVKSVHQKPNIDKCTIIAGITVDVATALHGLRQKKAVSISEIVEHGITFYDGI